MSDFGPLKDLTALTRLDLSGTNVIDLGPLAALASLDLSFATVVDLGPLAALASLTHPDMLYT